MATALDVAKWLIELAATEDGSEHLCHLRLQKLLYYAQGWSLSMRGKALFDERIEAWAYGPVVRDLYPVFSRFGSSSISPEVFGPPEKLSDDEAEFIKSVWDAYKGHSAVSLSAMTHAESPWQQARGGAGPADRSDAEISLESMREFFSKKPG